jgi:hypothetical protein
LSAVLALCAAAVVAGMRSFTAIAGWVADVPADLLACAYAGAAVPVPARGPSKSTIWRVLAGLDNAALDAAIGQWLIDPVEADPVEGSGSAAEAGPLSGVAVAADGKERRREKKRETWRCQLVCVRGFRSERGTDSTDDRADQGRRGRRGRLLHHTAGARRRPRRRPGDHR